MRQLQIFSLAAIFLSINAAGSLSAAEHPQYDIKASIDVSLKKVSARQTVIFSNNSQQNIDELYFHVYPNRQYTPREKNFMLRFAGYFKVDPYPEGFPQPHFDVRSVVNQGKDLPFEIEGEDKTLLKITLAQPLTPGEAVTVTIDFSVGIPHSYGRFGWHEDIFMLSRWYPILAVYNENGWNKNPFYPFHRPFFSEAAFYNVELTVPEQQVVIHSGQLQGEAREKGSAKILNIKTEQPVREFTFAMSPDYQVVVGEYDGIQIKSFYLPGDEARGQEALVNAKDALDYYTQQFGAYPYDVFSIAPVHLGYGGEQMSNLIFLDTRVYKLPKLLSRHFDFLIAHETGHQWLYNVVGINEYTQMWLEEGVNSYFVLGYLSNKYGEDAEVLDFPEWFKEWDWILPKLTFRKSRGFRYKTIARIQYDSPVVGELSGFSEPSSIFSLTYGKGSRIVEMLQYYIGVDAFDRVFARIFKEYRFRNLSVENFIQICEEESGQDLAWFFDQWLYKAEYFDCAISRVKGNRISIQNRGGIVMPVDVQVDFADGTQEIYRWNGKTEDGAIVVGKTAPVIRVEIDPQQRLLDIDRTNNSWPRKVNLQPVPIYLGLYDIPVFLPEDRYNVVFGPELANSGVGVKASVQKPYDQIFYTATNYEFGEQLHHSRMGYQLKNLFHTQTSLGFEISNTTDYDNGQDDLVSGKVYLRKELWPAQYGLGALNDHVSLYLIRNQGVNDSVEFFDGKEDSRNTTFSRRQEAITGVALHLDRSGPYPDPRKGYKLDAMVENSGHFLDATQFFYRAAVDMSFYQPVTRKTNLAMRLKYGWGYPDDKDLFNLGGPRNLRGFERKTERGSKAFIGSLEYRFPIKENIDLYCLDNILGLDSVGGVVFFDAGQSWFNDFADGRLRKDIGVGLRFKVNLGSFLEKVVIRFDAAKAINDADEDTEYWFGVNHAF